MNKSEEMMMNDEIVDKVVNSYKELSLEKKSVATKLMFTSYESANSVTLNDWDNENEDLMTSKSCLIAALSLMNEKDNAIKIAQSIRDFTHELYRSNLRTLLIEFIDNSYLH